MNDSAEREPTSTATTPETEPAVVAAISSADPAAREQTIRERAYAIWEEEARPAGRDLEHWLQAETEIDSGDASGRQGGSRPVPTLLNNCTFPIVCPHCGAQTHKTAQWFGNNSELICPCGSRLYLGTDELLIAIEGVEGALMRLIRSRPDSAEDQTAGQS